MSQHLLKDKLNFFKFLTIKLPHGDVYPHFIWPEKYTRKNILEFWGDYTEKIRQGQIYKNLGIFLKIPYCISKCFYCQCYSKVIKNQAEIDRYVNYICNELASYGPVLSGIKIDSLYFGGGTPSILTINQLKKIFKTFYDNYKLEVNSQINFEATPYSLNEGKIKLLKEFGVNRLTLGVQSLDEEVLKLNLRNKQREEMVREVVKLVKKYQINSLNIDLIGGLYGQSYESFFKSLKKIIALDPEMIHIYPFSASDETLFSKSGKKLLAKDLKLRHKMIEEGNELIIQSGYKEIRNDSYGKVEANRNKQEADNVEANASILALGYKARGHIFGELIYQIRNFEEKNYAEGILVDLEDEVTKYLIYNLRSPINLNGMFNIFSFYSLKKLKQKIKYLSLLKKVKLQDKLLIPQIKTRQEQLVYSKFLYKKEYLQKLADYYSKEYNPAMNYNQKLNYLIDDIQ